ncbi:MAG TPA: hypothetical protein VNO70_05905 [Blastocatellia bacterium]|nr:hypothetical protein [Blastocatellia bacterium]
MTCALCRSAIQSGDAVNLHHPLYKSQGGTATVPTHAGCHVAHHSKLGDFAAWGRLGGQITAATRRWALNLKNVSQYPAYDLHRSFYHAHYSH